jgi:hypothetical protein
MSFNFLNSELISDAGQILSLGHSCSHYYRKHNSLKETTFQFACTGPWRLTGGRLQAQGQPLLPPLAWLQQQLLYSNNKNLCITSGLHLVSVCSKLFYRSSSKLSLELTKYHSPLTI